MLKIIMLVVQGVFILSLFLGCNKNNEATETPTSGTEDPAESQTQQDNRSDADAAAKEDQEEQDGSFYPMTGEKPELLCGRDGFIYLYEGFLLKECGACHHNDNIYGVSVFAERTDVDSSFATIASGLVEKELFLKMVQQNTLCIACNLEADDPLLADIKEYWENPASCP